MTAQPAPSPRRGRPPRTAGPDGRTRLLQAARSEFGARGYGATTVQHLLEAAQVNAPSLYHHFEGKRGLFLAAAQDVYDEVLDRMRQAVGVPSDFTHAVNAVLDGALAMIDEDRAVARMFLVIQFELPRQPELAPDLRPILASYREFFDAIAALAPDHLAATPAERRDLGRALVAVISGLNGQALLLSHAADFPGLVARTRALLGLPRPGA